MSIETDTLLTALSEKFDRLATAWSADFQRTRSERIEFRSLIRALFEIADTAAPADAKVLRDAAAALATKAKAIGAKATAAAPGVPLDDGTPTEIAAATAAWRKRIDEARTRMREAREQLIS